MQQAAFGGCLVKVQQGSVVCVTEIVRKCMVVLLQVAVKVNNTSAEPVIHSTAFGHLFAA